MDNIEDQIEKMISIERILTSVLKNYGEIRIPALTFLEDSKSEQGIIMEYDEDGPSFVFKLGDKNEQ